MKSLTFNNLLEYTAECVSGSSVEGNVIFSNRAIRELFKYSEEEFLQLHISDLYRSESEYTRVINILSAKGSFRGVVRNRSKFGDEFACFLSANQVKDEEGEVVGHVGISYLIESGEAKENDLVNMFSHEKLSNLFYSIEMGIAISNANGGLSWCNSKYEELTGDMQTEVIGKGLLERFQVPHFALDDFLSSINGEGEYDFQFPFYKINTGLRWLHLKSSQFIYNKEKYRIESYSDITESKVKSIELLEVRERFDMISESIESVFFLYDFLSSTNEYVSSNSERILGYPPSFFYDDGFNRKDFVAEEHKAVLEKRKQWLLEKGTYEIEYKFFNGEKYIWLTEYGYSILDYSGKLTKASGVCMDITEKKEMQLRLEQKIKEEEESLQYASLIQQSALPNNKQLSQLFKEHFVLFKPKGGLSGDFYLAERVGRTYNQQKDILVVGDCTGHGIPGAILSILCVGLLKQIIYNPEVKQPSKALESVRKQLVHTLKNDELNMEKNGMDVGFAVFDEDFSKVTFSGAKSNLYIFRNNEWITIKGDRFFVGYDEVQKSFTDQTVDLQKNDFLFMFTDGFADQFGGKNNKKYLRSNLLKFLAYLIQRNLSVKEMKNALGQEFDEWKGEGEQVDDVCVFGFKVP